MKIFKFKLSNTLEKTVIEGYKIEKVLTVQYQGENICAWAIVDEEGEPNKVEIKVFGTGWDIDPDMEYITTLQEGPFIWHYFWKFA